MVRDKPETLMNAIKDAENAEGYMEKNGRISTIEVVNCYQFSTRKEKDI